MTKSNKTANLNNNNLPDQSKISQSSAENTVNLTFSPIDKDSDLPLSKSEPFLQKEHKALPSDIRPISPSFLSFSPSTLTQDTSVNSTKCFSVPNTNASLTLSYPTAEETSLFKIETDPNPDPKDLLNCNDAYLDSISSIDALCKSQLDSYKNDFLLRNNTSEQEKTMHLPDQFDYIEENCNSSISDSISDMHTSNDSSTDDENDNSNLKVNKTVLQYKSQANFDRYNIPKVDPIRKNIYIDKRSYCEVARDVIRVIESLYTKEEEELLSHAAGYDIRFDPYTPSGFPKMRQDILKELKRYKENNLSKEEEEIIDETIQMAERMKGPLPKKLEQGGFNIPKKDLNFKNKTFKDKKPYSLPETHSIDNLQVSQSCQCRSYFHDEVACPNKGQYCKETSCLNIETFQFQCICHPIGPIEQPVPVDDDVVHNTQPKQIKEIFQELNNTKNNFHFTKKEASILRIVQRHQFDISKRLFNKLITIAQKYLPQNIFLELTKSCHKTDSSDSLSEQLIQNCEAQANAQLPYIDATIAYKNKLCKQNHQLLLDSGSQVSILKLSSLSSLGVTSKNLDTNQKFILKTASGSKSNAAQGTLILSIFVTDDKNRVLKLHKTKFIIVSDDFKMGNDEFSGIIGSNIFEQKNAELKFVKNNVKFTANFINIRNEEIRSTITCLTPNTNQHCNALCVSKMSNQLTVNCELKIPSQQITTPSIYKIETKGNHYFEGMSCFKNLLPFNVASTRDQSNNIWPIATTNTTSIQLQPKDTLTSDISSHYYKDLKFTITPFQNDIIYQQYINKEIYSVNKCSVDNLWLDSIQQSSFNTSIEHNIPTLSKSVCEEVQDEHLVGHFRPTYCDNLLRPNFMDKRPISPPIPPLLPGSGNEKAHMHDNNPHFKDTFQSNVNSLDSSMPQLNSDTNSNSKNKFNSILSNNELFNCMQVNNIDVLNNQKLQSDYHHAACQLHAVHLDACPLQNDPRHCVLDNHSPDLDLCPCPRSSRPEDMHELLDYRIGESEKAIMYHCNKIVQNPWHGYQKEAFKEEPFKLRDTPVDEELMDKHDLMLLNRKEIEDFDLSHISDKSTKLKIQQLIVKYKGTFATETRKIGKFTPYEIKLEVKDEINTRQQDRHIKFGKFAEAKQQVLDLIKEGILKPVDPKNPLKSIANFVIVPKANLSGIRDNSKASRQMARSEGQLKYRLTADMSSLNSKLLGPTYIQTPSEHDIRLAIRSSLCTICDISQGFPSLVLDRNSRKYVTLYFEDQLLEMSRLMQGLCTAPCQFSESIRFTFRPEAFQKLLRSKNWLKKDFPYTSFKDFIFTYLDDIIIYSPLGQEDLHLKCVELVFAALKAVGFLISPKKTSILTSKFTFLGKHFNVRENYSCLTDSRLQTIVNMRRPLSIGELSSRISFFYYSSTYIPYARKIMFPLIRLAASGKYRWTKLEEESYNNLKFLCCLCFRNYLFDPKLPSFIECDSSKLISSYFFFQVDTDGVIKPVATGSTTLSASEVRSIAPVREANTLAWSVAQCEYMILNSESSVTILTDSQPLSYIRNMKKFYSRYYELSLALSSYQSLDICYVPGKFICMSDEVTRAIQDVVIKNEVDVSENFAKITFPLPHSLKDKFLKMTSQELRTFLLSDMEPNLFDIDAKNYKYTQTFTGHDIHKFLREASTEQLLFSYLLCPTDNKDLYKLSIFRELAGTQKVLSKTGFLETLKKWKLAGLHKKLKDLGISGSFFEKLKANFTEEEKKESLEKIAQMKLPKKCTKSTSLIIADSMKVQTRSSQIENKVPLSPKTKAPTPPPPKQTLSRSRSTSLQSRSYSRPTSPMILRPRSRSRSTSRQTRSRSYQRSSSPSSLTPTHRSQPIPQVSPPSITPTPLNPSPTRSDVPDKNISLSENNDKDVVAPPGSDNDEDPSHPEDDPQVTSHEPDLTRNHTSSSKHKRPSRNNRKHKTNLYNPNQHLNCDHHHSNPQCKEKMNEIIHYLQNTDTCSKIIELARAFSNVLFVESDLSHKEIRNYIKSLEDTKCIFEKIHYIKLILTRIFSLINEETISIGNKNAPDRNFRPFVYYFDSKECKMQINEKNIQIFSNQTFHLQQFQSAYIDIQLFTSLRETTTFINLPQNIHAELDAFIDFSGFYLRKMLIFNMTNKSVTISPGQILLTLQFSSNSKYNYLPLKVNENFIQQKIRNLNSFSSFLSVQKWENILTKYLITHSNYSKCLPKSEEQEIISSAIHRMNQEWEEVPIMSPDCDLYDHPVCHHDTGHTSTSISLCSVRALSQPFNALDNMSEEQFSKLSNQSRDALNSILINKSLHQTAGSLKLADLQEIQQNDPEIMEKIRKCKNQQLKNYEIKDDLLYKVDLPFNSSIKTFRLVLPAFISKSIMSTLHKSRLAHLGANQMDMTFSTLFYNSQSKEIAKYVSSKCPGCLLGTNYRKQNWRGERRSLDSVMSPGMSLSLDCIYLPRSSDGYCGMLLIVCNLTGYLCSFALRSITAKEVVKAFRLYLQCHHAPLFLSGDAGPENSTLLLDELKRHNICFISPSASHSNSQASVEAAANGYKQLLNKCINNFTENSRKLWPRFIPSLNQIYNSARPYAAKMCRTSLRYSPLITLNPGYGTVLFEDDDLAPEAHKRELHNIRELRRNIMERDYYYDSRRKFYPGCIAILIVPRSKRQTVDGSKQLLPGVKKVVRIIRHISGDIYQTKCLTTGLLNNTHANDMKRISIPDLYEIHLNASELFKHIQTSRINRQYRKIIRGLQLSNNPKTSPLRNPLPTGSQDDTPHDDVIEDDFTGDVNATTQASVSTVTGTKPNAKTNFKSILKVKICPAPSTFAMSKNELKALNRGIKMSLQLNLPLPSTLPSTFQNCKQLVTPTNTRHSITLSKIDYQSPRPPSKLTFHPSTKMCNFLQSINIYVCHPASVKQAMINCVSLRENFLNTNLF